MSPSSDYFAWRHYHPHEAEDPSALWAAAYKAGGRAAIANSARVCDLVPQLRELLYLLEDGQVEGLVRSSDRRPAFVADDECEVQW
jgi:hypothetical protein